MTATHITVTENNNNHNTMNGTERRKGTDRRRWTCNHDFPYVDTHGVLVVRNRRNNTERRLADEGNAKKR